MFWRGKKENKAKLEHKLYLARENPEPTFELSACDLRNVPGGIYSLCRVFLKEQLDLSYNQLTSLSGGGQLGDLQVLRTLVINNNAFMYLPDEIQLLTNLKELYVQNNQLKKLPLTICNLEKLRVLNVSNNMLKQLPDDIGKLVKLEKLSILANGRLKQLPKSICRCRKLNILEFNSDNFLYPPMEVANMGLEAIMKYICDDTNYEYVPQEIVEDEVVSQREETDFSPCSDFEAKIWELEKIKENKLREFLAIERHNELMQQQEFELANSLKASKEKLLADIVTQQIKFDKSLDKIHQAKDIERFKLIEQLKEVEQNADIAINQLLAISREPHALLIEQESLEQERIIAAANVYNENLCRNEVLKAMEELLEKETARFKEFDKFRSETSRSILEHEIQSDTHLLDVLKEQETKNRELAAQLQEDEELQKLAVAALLERSDARCWSLVQQVMLVESQLAALTLIEMDRQKLQMDQHLNDLAEKRISLSILLMDLLEQQGIRRTELLSTLHTLEENNDDAEDFWLRQYQQLLDRMPEGLSEFQKNLNPALIQALLMAGVVSYLPFIAKWSQNEDALINIADEDLKDAGIQNSNDRAKILHVLQVYKQQTKSCSFYEEGPSAPPIPIDEASAPPVETTQSYGTSECVVCMDSKCEIIYVPCGHFCCCLNCSGPLVECPMCRASIERKIRVNQS